ncbi:hypothetical protein [Streptomyces sp. cmx-4-7]|uniref:hypothetical protein n=1 Tax=unclassified Streptomyces TaxID=2593676 RepID=UPI00397F7DCF
MRRIGTAVLAGLLLTGCEATATVDRASYEAGYEAIRIAMPGSDEGRSAVEERCRELWREFSSEGIVDLNQGDWVAGCADCTEGKDSRFADK